jgi:hypothetical protein
MILFNTLTDGEYRTTMNGTFPRLLESQDDRVKFIAAIRSPVARDVLNFDGEINKMSITMRSKLETMLREQNDEEFLKTAQLPKVPKKNSGPVISQV